MLVINIRPFALICWLLWAALFAAASIGAMPWPLAALLGVSVYALWRLYRQAVIVHA
jgi:hypothetical protein